MSAPTDEPPLVLPELLQQDIDEDTLRALFRDVSALGEALEVLVKTTSLQHASPERTVRFEQLVLSGLAQDILSLNQAADLMNMKMGDFRKKYSEVI